MTSTKVCNGQVCLCSGLASLTVVLARRETRTLSPCWFSRRSKDVALRQYSGRWAHHLRLLTTSCGIQHLVGTRCCSSHKLYLITSTRARSQCPRLFKLYPLVDPDTVCPSQPDSPARTRYHTPRISFPHGTPHCPCTSGCHTSNHQRAVPSPRRTLILGD